MQRIIFNSLFLIILFSGIFLRFYQLGGIPDSLNWDEVSWGYNAFSILETGKDEHGITLPLTFKAFGDYKQPVYVYSQVIPILLFGLNSFAVRFPSAFFGSLTILSVYFMVYELFFNKSQPKNLAIIGMAFFAFSPWSIQFSRVAFEANVGIFFTITGVWLFLRGIRLKQLLLMATGSIIMSLSCYTYHSQKVFTPLLFAGLLVYANDYLLENKKRVLLIILVFILSNSLWLADSRTTQRGRSVMFTSQQTQILQKSTQKIDEDRNDNNQIATILHNRRVVYTTKYIENYLLHFDPNFLFINGDNARHHAPRSGVLFLFTLPFILLGMILSWKENRKQLWIIFYWLLLAPVASALAVDAPNASRSMVFLPTWQIFTAYGLMQTFLYLKNKEFKISAFKFKTHAFFMFVILFISLANVSIYIHEYFKHTDTDFSAYWQYGYREAVILANEFENKNIVYLSDIEQPYIFHLFYNKVDPLTYLKDGGSERLKKDCFSINNSFFGKCEAEIREGSIVVTGKKESISQLKGIPVKVINHPNGEPAIYLYNL